MHILLIHQAFAALDEPGGTRHHELARFLAEKGHRVTIIASPISYLTGTTRQDSEASTGEEPGITIRRVYTYPALHKSFIHRVISFVSFMVSSFMAGLQVSDIDLVWGTSPPIFQGLTSWAVAKFKGAPFFFEVRDLWPDFAIQVGVLQNSWLIRASFWLERFLYQQARHVMVNSPGYVAHVQQRGARQVALIPNGADATMFDPADDGHDFRQKHHIEGKFIALYAGAHGVSNDLGTLLEAAELLNDDPNIVIVLLGDGKEKPALVKKATAMGLQNVIFLPPIAKNEMSGALAASNACIAILKPIPLYATTYPNKVFDYMAAGRPVVLAIDGFIRQVIDEAQAGLFVNPGEPEALANAIRQLAADPQTAQNMGIRGRRVVMEQFDRSALAQRLEILLQELIQRK